MKQGYDDSSDLSAAAGLLLIGCGAIVFVGLIVLGAVLAEWIYR